jgi:hypothetical protein
MSVNLPKNQDGTNSVETNNKIAGLFDTFDYNKGYRDGVKQAKRVVEGGGYQEILEFGLAHNQGSLMPYCNGYSDGVAEVISKQCPDIYEAIIKLSYLGASIKNLNSPKPKQPTTQVASVKTTGIDNPQNKSARRIKF